MVGLLKRAQNKQKNESKELAELRKKVEQLESEKEFSDIKKEENTPEEVITSEEDEFFEDPEEEQETDNQEIKPKQVDSNPDEMYLKMGQYLAAAIDLYIINLTNDEQK